MNKVLLPIIIGIGLSIPFVTGYLSSENSTTNIDSRILEFYEEFVLQSNAVVHSVDLMYDDIPYIVLIFDRTHAGHVVMNDPLLLFQELFPDENVTMLVVLADGKEIPYDTENNLLRFNFSNTEIVVIGGK